MEAHIFRIFSRKRLKTFTNPYNEFDDSETAVDSASLRYSRWIYLTAEKF